MLAQMQCARSSLGGCGLASREDVVRGSGEDVVRGSVTISYGVLGGCSTKECCGPYAGFSCGRRTRASRARRKWGLLFRWGRPGESRVGVARGCSVGVGRGFRVVV